MSLKLYFLDSDVDGRAWMQEVGYRANFPPPSEQLYVTIEDYQEQLEKRSRAADRADRLLARLEAIAELADRPEPRHLRGRTLTEP